MKHTVSWGLQLRRQTPGTLGDVHRGYDRPVEEMAGFDQGFRRDFMQKSSRNKVSVRVDKLVRGVGEENSKMRKPEGNT